MFSYIKGEVTELSVSSATLETGNIGYSLTISASTHGKLISLPQDSTAKLYTYFSVKEDGIELFGFYDKEELNFFKLLIGVSGVGPKAAISILSAFSVAELASAILSDKPKVISAAQGIGPKTASRIILELKDKIGGFTQSPEAPEILSNSSSTFGNKLLDAESALEVLGYSRSEIQNALKDVDASGLTVEDIIRICLSKLM